MPLAWLLAGLAVASAATGRRAEVPIGERILATIADREDRIAVNEEGRLVYGVQSGRWVYTFQRSTTSVVRGHAGPKIIALLSKVEVPERRHLDVQRGMVEMWLFEEVRGKLVPVPDWKPVILGEGFFPMGVRVSPEKFGGEVAVAIFCEYVRYDRLTKPRHRIREGVLLYPLHGQFVEVFRTELEDRYEDPDRRLDWIERSVFKLRDLDRDGYDEILVARSHTFADGQDLAELRRIARGSFEVYSYVPEKAARLDIVLSRRKTEPDRYLRVPAPVPPTPSPAAPRETEVHVTAGTYNVSYLDVYDRKGWYLPRLSRWVKQDSTVGVAVRGGNPPLIGMDYVPGADESAIRRRYLALDLHPISVRPRAFTRAGKGREEGAQLHLRWTGRGVWASFHLSDDRTLEALPFETADVDAVEIGLAPEAGPGSFGTPVRALIKLDRSDKHGAWFRTIPEEDSQTFTMRLFDLPSPDWIKRVPDRFPRERPRGAAAAGWMQPAQWGLEAAPTPVPGLSLPHPTAGGDRPAPYLDILYEFFVPWNRLGWGGVVPEFLRFYTVVVDTDVPGDRPARVVPFPDARATLDPRNPATWASAVVEY